MNERSPYPPLASRPPWESLQMVRRPSLLVQERRSAFVGGLQVAVGKMLGEAHPLNSTDDNSIVTQLSEAVVFALAYGGDVEEIEDQLRRLGWWLRQCNVSSSLYSTIAKAMIHAIRDAIGDEWSSALGSHWAGICVWVSEALVSGGYLADVSEPAEPAQPVPAVVPAVVRAVVPTAAGAERSIQDMIFASRPESPVEAASTPPEPAAEPQLKPAGRKRRRTGMAAFFVAQGVVDEDMADNPMHASESVVQRLFDDPD